MSPGMTQTDDFQLCLWKVIMLMRDTVQITSTPNDVFVICVKMPVWVLLGGKKWFENLCKYIAGFNKSISAEYHPTAQASPVLVIHESFNPK